MSCAECTSCELAVDWTCLKCGVCLHDKCIERHRANKAETTHSIIPKMDALFQAPAGTSKESNPDKIEVHGPGIEPEGVLGEFDPTFNVKTQGAGPGRLGVNIRGPKGTFNVKMEKHTEDKTIIVCSYEANEPGDYVISVTWGDIEVRGSPFKVNVRNKT